MNQTTPMHDQTIAGSAPMNTMNTTTDDMSAEAAAPSKKIPKKISLNYYLSMRLIVPYHTHAKHDSIFSFWTEIFSYIDPASTSRIHLRRLCNMFKASLKAPPKGMFTEFPHENHASIDSLFNRLNELYDEDPTSAPTILFLHEGDHEVVDGKYLTIRYPLKIFGAGRHKTFIRGGGFKIEGKSKEEEAKVLLSEMTVIAAKQHGLFGMNGLSFLCDSLTFTQCVAAGVYAYHTNGRLLNCTVTQCEQSGIYGNYKALIELAGSQTKVEGNATHKEPEYTFYGLHTASSDASILLLSPLTKQIVSFNNSGGKNYGSDMFGSIRGGGDSIRTVDSFH